MLQAINAIYRDSFNLGKVCEFVGLSKEDRRDVIFNLSKEGDLTAETLSDKFEVSASTIRTDFISLVDSGKMICEESSSNYATKVFRAA